MAITAFVLAAWCFIMTVKIARVMRDKMKETTAYFSEFLAIVCPYCGKKIYEDTEDSPTESYISEGGIKSKCPECKNVMLIVPGSS